MFVACGEPSKEARCFYHAHTGKGGQRRAQHSAAEQHEFLHPHPGRQAEDPGDEVDEEEEVRPGGVEHVLHVVEDQGHVDAGYHIQGMKNEDAPDISVLKSET